MPSDNVTPFRRRPPPKPVQRGGGLTSHRGKAVLAQALTLAAFGLSFVFAAPPLSYIAMAVAIAGGAVALSNRAEAMPWAQTHHEHALRTLIIGYAILTLASLLIFISGSMLIVYFYVQIAVTIWAALRAGIGLVLAIMRKPIWNPRGPLV
ncbi:MAG: hypothetical protein NW206_15210 [Hyphomonadaceae bacterium]|nr:hypothetical protein [Hyphomonadaceae bacterium]